MAAVMVQDGLIDLLRQEHYERVWKLARGRVDHQMHMVWVQHQISEVAHNVMQQVKCAVETACRPVQQIDVQVEG